MQFQLASRYSFKYGRYVSQKTILGLGQGLKYSSAVFLAGLIGLSACSKPQPPPLVDEAITASVVGGHLVKAGNELKKSVVAVVAQNNEGDSLCTGSIIAEDMILTAAHCVEKDSGRLTVVFAIQLKGVTDSVVRRADAVIQHPLWHKQGGKRSRRHCARSFHWWLAKKLCSGRACADRV